MEPNLTPKTSRSLLVIRCLKLKVQNKLKTHKIRRNKKRINLTYQFQHFKIILKAENI